MSFLFEVKGLSKSFVINDKKSVSVLNDIDFVLPSKGLYFIFGKSGCGKSTLLNILESLMEPSSGSVFYKNKDLSKFSEKELQNYRKNEIGIVFQSYNLLNDCTVYDNLKITSEIKGKNLDKKIDEYLKKFKFENFKNKKVSLLSGGEKQRIAIIRAIINEPEVIFCDEPTGHLDEINTEKVMNDLLEVSKSRLVIVVTHNKKIIERYKNGYIELFDGKIRRFDLPYQKTDDNKSEVKKDSKSKIKYIIENKFKKDSKRNALSFFTSFFSFLLIIFSFAFINGINENTEKLIYEFQDYNVFKVSKIVYKSIDDSVLKLKKNEQPSEHEVNNLLQSYNDYSINFSYDYFFSDGVKSSSNNKLIDSISYNPCFNIRSSNSVYVNNKFAELFEKEVGMPCLNQHLYVTINKSIEDDIYNEDVSTTIDFVIRQVNNEFSYLNTPKVYYSYTFIEDFFRTKYCNNENFWDLTIFDLLNNLSSNNPSLNYCYIVNFMTQKSCDRFYKEKDKFSNFEISNTEYDTVNSFIELSSSLKNCLYFFIAISIACCLCTLGFVNYANFNKNRKESAIFSILGLSNNEIRNIYNDLNIILALLGIAVSTILYFITQSFINKLIYKYTCFSGLFFIGTNNLFLLFILALLFVFVVMLFVSIPLMFAKRIELYKEVKEE